MSYSHLEDEALVRNVLNDFPESGLIRELASRLELQIHDVSQSDEISELESSYDNLEGELCEIKDRIDKAEEYAVIISEKHGFRDEIFYGYIDETISTLCDKIDELIDDKQ